MNSVNMNQYIKNKFNKLTLAIERENLTYKREFKIVFSSSGVSSIEEINRDNNQIDINGGDNGQKMLFDKIAPHIKNTKTFKIPNFLHTSFSKEMV